MKDKIQKNSGSTLILAIIVLSAILAAAITFGVVSLSDYRQSVWIDQSVVSYYLAEIGVERGAFYFRKHGETLGAGDCGISDCSLEVELEDRGDIGFVAKDQSVQIDIYHPTITPDIQYLYATWSDDGVFPDPTLEVSWAGWDAASFGDPIRRTLSDGLGSQVNLYDAGVYNFFRVRIRPIIDDIQYLQITAWDGVPFASNQETIPGTAEIKAIGSYGNSRQAVAITTTHLNPLSGLYDYVLFSEEEILKSFCGDGVVEGSELCDDGRKCEDGSDCTTEGDSICTFIIPGDPPVVIDNRPCLPRNGDGCSASCEL